MVLLTIQIIIKNLISRKQWITNNSKHCYAPIIPIDVVEYFSDVKGQ